MNELEQYLDRVCRPLGGSKSLRRHIREELREHLLAAVEQHVGEGLSQAQAAAKAIEEFGEPETVRGGLEALYGRRVTALLIEKAMQWKERNMKTGWKWSFAAHFLLLLILAAEALFALAAAVFVVPLLRYHYDGLELLLPGFSRTTIGLLLGACEMWFIWLPLLAIGWGLFEWRCRSESKATIRLAGLALASLVLTLFVCVVSAAVVVPMVRLPRLIRSQQSETVVRRKLAQAAASLERLSQAAGKHEWPAAEEPARRLRDSLRYLAGTDLAAAALAAAQGDEQVGQIRRLLKDAADLSDDVYASIRRHAPLETQVHLARLEASCGQLRAKLPPQEGGALSASTRPAAPAPGAAGK